MNLGTLVGNMRHGGAWLLLAMSFAGCEDAAKRPVQAHAPALEPQQTQQAHVAQGAQAQPMQARVPQAGPSTVGNLPLRNLKTQPLISLTPRMPGGIPYLIEIVKAKFASGEANYKAGHLAAARRDFDDAVDWRLESGYDPNSHPKLSELFHQATDTIYAYELQAFRAGDGFSEAPAVPAPIDEVAEMTFPVDPKLKERAEEAAKSLSHDLPLTVNDVVVSYLNFFQTPRGRAIVETGLRRKGKYDDMIARVLREKGVPQDLIYLAQAESAFQPLALSRPGARGISQSLHCRGNEYGWTRRKGLERRRSTCAIFTGFSGIGTWRSPRITAGRETCRRAWSGRGMRISGSCIREMCCRGRRKIMCRSSWL